MSHGLDRLRTLIDRLEADEDVKARQGLIRAYLSTLRNDLDDLTADDPVSVDLTLSALVSVWGVKEQAKTVERIVKEARRPSGRKLRLVDDDEGSASLFEVVGEDAPGPVASLVVPEGFVIGPSGVLGPVIDVETGERPIVAARPVYLAGLLRDVHTGALHVDLAWRQPFGAWAIETVARGTVADSRRLVSTADRGVPVDSTTSSNLVRYLSAFEAANAKRLPCGAASSVLGWQGDNGREGFLWGEKCLAGREEAPVRLLADEGKRQIADAYDARGSLEGWGEVWARVSDHPRVALGVYASLAPLVLGIVNEAPGFVLDWSGRSTGGKTTTLRVAASVWGDPDALIYQWRATLNAIEHVAAFSRHLPTFLDDTKQASDNPSKVAAVIYQTTGLRGKLRASPDGLRETASFRTVLLSTGEVRATSFTEDVGAHARTLCVQGFPFEGGDKPENRVLAEWLRLRCSDHFGQVGPRVVAWLAENRSAWPAFRKRWRTTCDEEAARDTSSAFLGRAAPYLATIRFAAYAMREATGLPVCEAALVEASRWASVGASDARRHLAALHDVLGWITTRQASFVTEAEGPRDREVLGRWSHSSPPSVIAKPLDDFLAGCGYDVEGIASEWLREGWIEAPAGRTTKQVRIGVGRPLCYVFTEAAIRAASSETR